MGLISCPECGKSISDKAISCPGCGYPLKPEVGYTGGTFYGYEYKSDRTLFNLPLVHIAYGPGPMGRPRVAKGIIAIGNVAFGFIALGGIGVGFITLAGIGLGLVCLAGMAFGILLGAGGVATGYIAVGGLAIGVYAIGGLSIGIHTLNNDPHLREMLKTLWGLFPSNYP
jgi:hypothetical protein